MATFQMHGPDPDEILIELKLMLTDAYTMVTPCRTIQTITKRKLPFGFGLAGMATFRAELHTHTGSINFDNLNICKNYFYK